MPEHANDTLTDDGANTYAWDAENRLSSVTRKSDGAVLATYTYDASSRLIRRQAGSDDTLHLYDGWNRIADYANGSAPSLRKTYLWGLDMSGSLQGAGGVGGLLALSKHGGPSPVSHYPTYDGNGNISEYLDSAGTVSAHFEYDPFGNTTVNTDTNSAFPYRFSTKPQDATTGCYYYGYRWYDAVNGRWINRDPIEEKGGLNLYGFNLNQSVYKVDFLGKMSSTNCLPNNNVVIACQKDGGWVPKSISFPDMLEADYVNYIDNIAVTWTAKAALVCSCGKAVCGETECSEREVTTSVTGIGLSGATTTGPITLPTFSSITEGIGQAITSLIGYSNSGIKSNPILMAAVTVEVNAMKPEDIAAGKWKVGAPSKCKGY